MKDIYVAVTWLEIQDFMEHEDYPTEVGFGPNMNLWFVPQEMYNEVYNID